MTKIRICGVGSVLLGDDAAGPYAAHWIAAHYEFANPEGLAKPGEHVGQQMLGVQVEVEDLGTPGLDLIAYMTGVDVLILIDSVANRMPPGTVTTYDKEALHRQRLAVRLDPHSPCITESISVAELAGEGPSHVYLIGVTPKQFDLGAPLSDDVRDAIPRAVETALERAAFHGGCYRKRDTPAELGVWWEPVPAAGIPPKTQVVP